MFERFTDRTRRVIVLAGEAQRSMGSDAIGTEHLVLALLMEGESVAAIVLHNLGVNLEAVRKHVEERQSTADAAKNVPFGVAQFTPRAKKVLELSLREALQLGHNYIGTEHVLLGLIREGEGVAAHVLVEDCGIDLSAIRQEVIKTLGGYAAEESARRAGSADKPADYVADLIERAKKYGVARATADPGLLTAVEKAALETSGTLAGLCREICGHGPQAENDYTEMVAHLHVIQRYVLSQAAARAYPGQYRELGQSLRDGA